MTIPACTTCGLCCVAPYPEATDYLPSEGLAPEYDALTDDGDCEPRVMRLVAGRCVALEGEVGRSCACSIYEGRPTVCREYEPGGPLCRMLLIEYAAEIG